jgi:hypothetical protein
MASSPNWCARRIWSNLSADSGPTGERLQTLWQPARCPCNRRRWRKSRTVRDARGSTPGGSLPSTASCPVRIGVRNRWVYPRKYSLLGRVLPRWHHAGGPAAAVQSLRAEAGTGATVAAGARSPASAALTYYEEWDQEDAYSRRFIGTGSRSPRRLTERGAIHDLKAMLRLINAGKLAVSDKTRQPGAAGLRTDGRAIAGRRFL